MYPQQMLPPGLPVDPSRPMHNYLMLQANNPPFCPNPAVVTPDLQLQQYVPAIAALCAIEVQGAAQQQPQNPLRMFMFNLLAQNNYANQEFEKLVIAATEFFWLNVVKGTYGQYPDAKLPEAVAQMVEMVRAVYMQTFPALQPLCDPNLQHNAAGLITTFAQTASEINAWKQRMGYGGQPVYGAAQGGYGQPQQPTYGQPNVQPPFQGRTYGTPVNAWQTQGGVPAGAAMPPGQQLFGQQRMVQPPGVGAGPVDTSRYDRDVVRQPFQPRQEAPAPSPTPAPPAPAPVQEETEQLLTLAKIKWVPTESFPYIPAYNPAVDQLFFRALPTGGFKPILIPRKDPVDYDRHAISSTFGPRPRGADPTKSIEALERITKGLEQVNQQPSTAPAEGEAEEVEIPFTLVVRADEEDGVVWTPREASPGPVYLIGELERLGKIVDDRPVDIYRLHAKLYDPVVGEADETHWVDNFGECETLVTLRNKLVAAASEISPSLYQTVNRRMTQAINRAIRLNLSIPVLKIDSFADDLDDLLKALERRGELILGSFMRQQKSLIQRQLITLPEDEANEEETQFVNPKRFSGEPPKITFVTSNVTVTLLNCRSHELNVELAPDGLGTGLQRDNMPLLYALVKDIFDAETTKQFVEKYGEFDRHLIRTLDGRVIEANRGWLDDDYFVLTLVE